MEGLSLVADSRVRGPSPRFASSKCGNFRPLRGLDPRILAHSRKLAPLSCTRGQEESIDGFAGVAYASGYLADSVEVMEWESGKSLDDIAAKQGIRIRRSPPISQEHGESAPRNILEKIIWTKDLEVSQLKNRKPLALLNEALEDAPPVRDFIGALKASYLRTGMPALIAEVKKASPSRGVLRHDFDPVQIAKAYERNGAACLSILTDEKYFQGSFENLQAVHEAGVKCPLLCKEFIIDPWQIYYARLKGAPWQIYYARLKGADAVLLIAGVLTDLDIKCMTMVCGKLGLVALVEVHNEMEIDRVLNIDGVQLIGINNRNLETFEGITVVGESGLFTPEDISYVQDAGVKAVLVGESLIKQSDPGKAIAGLFGKDISL
ncbi:hypothetical protein J5N97_006571 [Dioscorea zingiberensis]|uniref:indole-3-glycerol-phosphate synthase n=1 Tax=Dioscorea zingiberensis TaxID=325984 RepID=A0A9D5HSV3_9LILI|nr:hypothetical protein J5N97_006571 [Dioscorea zingiberensis]